MKWKQFRLTTRVAAEDIVSAVLADCGIEGVEIQDRMPLTEEEKKQMFVDLAPEAEQEDDTAFLTFYLDPETDVEAKLRQIREELEALRPFCEIGSCEIDIAETEDVDWINNWKQYFHQFAIGQIRIVPSWEEPEVTGAEELVLHIDPGTAFGTGLHETTQLCIQQIEKRMQPGMRVLDIGTGSGILALLACKRGAAEAVGTDLDPCAASAVEENCVRNGVAFGSQLRFLLGNLLDDTAVQKAVGEKCYDLVCTNILADVLVPLAPAVAKAVRPGGVWITSGILEGKEQLVTEAAERAGFLLEESANQGEWVGLTFRMTEEDAETLL